MGRGESAEAVLARICREAADQEDRRADFAETGEERVARRWLAEQIRRLVGSRAVGGGRGAVKEVARGVGGRGADQARGQGAGVLPQGPRV